MNHGDNPLPLWKKSVLRDLLEAQGKSIKKSLGQHYLIDPYYVEQIAVRVKSLCDEQCHLTTIVEIGPGLGTLTQALLLQKLAVTAVEVDNSSIKVLEHNFPASLRSGKLKVVESDVLKWQVKNEELMGSEWLVVGNLPYNITSPILFKLAEEWPVASALVMMQKEVGERLCSPAGIKNYGILSVLIRYSFRAKKYLSLSGECFYPKPNVASEVLELERIDRVKEQLPVAEDYFLFKKIVKAAFHNRRKKVTNSIENYWKVNSKTKSKSEVLEQRFLSEEFSSTKFLTCLKEVVGSEQVRAEELTIENYIDLSNLYSLSD